MRGHVKAYTRYMRVCIVACESVITVRVEAKQTYFRYLNRATQQPQHWHQQCLHKCCCYLSMAYGYSVRTRVKIHYA